MVTTSKIQNGTRTCESVGGATDGHGVARRCSAPVDAMNGGWGLAGAAEGGQREGRGGRTGRVARFDFMTKSCVRKSFGSVFDSETQVMSRNQIQANSNQKIQFKSYQIVLGRQGRSGRLGEGHKLHRKVLRCWRTVIRASLSELQVCGCSHQFR